MISPLLGAIKSALDIVKYLGLVLFGMKWNQSKHDKQRADNAEEEAQKWADRPRTDGDFIKRMHNIIKRSKD